MTEPTIRVLSLGAGVQSTTLALMSAAGQLPKLDAAIFADTMWEPRRVYQVLEKLEARLRDAGIPTYRVAYDDLRATSLPGGGVTTGAGNRFTFAWIPYRTKTERPGKPPRRGMGQRRCTYNFKMRPIERKVRELLGAEPPRYRSVKKGRVAEVWVGFSTDEITRVNDRQRVRYIRNTHPLLDLGMSRDDCNAYLAEQGWGHVAKSACIGCPFHGDAQWRDMRDNYPDEWMDAVDFDRGIRDGGANPLPANTTAYLHRSLLPLDRAPIDDDAVKEDPDGCSPYGCRSGVAQTS